MQTEEALDAAIHAVSTLADKIATDVVAFAAPIRLSDEDARTLGTYGDLALKLSQAAINLVAIENTLDQLERQRARDEMAGALTRLQSDGAAMTRQQPGD